MTTGLMRGRRGKRSWVSLTMTMTTATGFEDEASFDEASDSEPKRRNRTAASRSCTTEEKPVVAAVAGCIMEEMFLHADFRNMYDTVSAFRYCCDWVCS